MSTLDFRVLDDAIAQELSERFSDVFRTETFGEVIAAFVVEGCERLDHRAVECAEAPQEVERRTAAES
jgi:hypothetical protein